MVSCDTAVGDRKQPTRASHQTSTLTNTLHTRRKIKAPNNQENVLAATRLHAMQAQKEREGSTKPKSGCLLGQKAKDKPFSIAEC